MKVCAESGCPTLTSTSRCPTHARVVDKARGTRQARGYNAAHDRERARWAPLVRTGLIDCNAPTCLMPTRRIASSSAWDLGHTPDRTSWTGPEHARCNRAAGGHASHSNAS